MTLSARLVKVTSNQLAGKDHQLPSRTSPSGFGVAITADEGVLARGGLPSVWYVLHCGYYSWAWKMASFSKQALSNLTRIPTMLVKSAYPSKSWAPLEVNMNRRLNSGQRLGELDLTQKLVGCPLYHAKFSKKSWRWAPTALLSAAKEVSRVVSFRKRRKSSSQPTPYVHEICKGWAANI